MALDTYANLLLALADEVERSDVAAKAADAVALAEAEFNRRLRVNRMLVRAQATITDGFSDVPADFLAPRSMRAVSSPYPLLRFLTGEQMGEFKNTLPSGDLAYYALVGTEFEYGPTPVTSQDVEFTYYQMIPALVTNSTNWLLALYPDAYFHGAMLHLANWEEDQTRAQNHASLFGAALDGIKAADRGDSYAANLTPTASAYVV